MTIGLGVFIACDVLGAVLAAVSCRRTWRWHGRAATVKEAVVMTLGLAAYTGTCLWLGYSLGAQCLAFVASAVPLWLGRRYVPSLDENEMRGNR